MRKLIVFIDSGDTIIDESTEIRNEHGVVVSAACIPGARETLFALHEAGFPLYLVADGLTQSFLNMFEQNGISQLFSEFITSEDVGAEKPDARMFQAAMDAAGLTDLDKPRIIMVGNNLARDVLGANLFGIVSVHQAWTPRYPKVPACADEKPRHVIAEPGELLPLALSLDAALAD